MTDVTCSNCGRENRPGARFCAGCAQPILAACTSCGEPLAPDAGFCDQCGTPVAAATEHDAVRKTVTVLFGDLVGSTAFGEGVDPESVRDVLGRYHSMAQRTIEDHEGTVAKFIGDGVMAVFGIPEVAVDDADRAVAAGLDLQRAFGAIHTLVRDRYGIDLGLRVGINTGEVVIAESDADIVGDVLNTAARLEAVCVPGQVLVGEDTWRLTRSTIRYETLGEIELKGKRDAVATFQAVDEATPPDESSTPFVGRDDEMTRLRAVFDDAVRTGEARLATVIGAPGVGKTRLAAELERELGSAASTVDLRVERAGGTTFSPVTDLLRAVASLEEGDEPEHVLTTLRELLADLDDRERIATLLASFVGATETRSTEELFFAVRRLLEALSRRRPMVMVIDDIQWAEPLFLDLLEHLVEWVRDAPAMLLALARPELREIRPALSEPGRRVADSLSLEGLDAAATAELAAQLVGGSALPSELLTRLPESTEGNPLFVRELMTMLVDDKVIVETERGWELTIDAEAVEVPPTIQSLLSSRIERMPEDERRLLELASVVGPDFPVGAVAALSSRGDAGRLIPALERLRRKELVEPTGAYWGNEPVFRFHHVLIRDAAYRRLLKGTRADLHLQVAEWMQSGASAVSGEHEVTTGYHLEQAHDLRRQLNTNDDETAAIGRRAADVLGTAAQRALERDDVAAASSLAIRAVALLEPEAPALPDLLMLGCEALLALGDVGAAAPLLEQLESRAAGDERLGAWAASFRAQLIVLTEPDRLLDAEDQASDAAEVLAGLGDRTGEASARLVRAGALARLGHIGACEAELDKALTAARAADDGRRVASVLGAAPVAALWGPSPVSRAGGRCLDVLRLLRITTGSPRVEATSMRCQAVLEGLRGRFDTARTMLAHARTSVEDLGDRHGLLETRLYQGIVELLAQDPGAAEPHLRAAYGGLGHLGIGADAGQAAAHLSRSLLQQGRLEEAAELAADSEALAGQNPQTAIAAKTAHAEILAAQGDLNRALRVAEEAVALAQGTDILIDHANADLALARVRSTAGDVTGAQEALQAAERLFVAKGASIDVVVDLSLPGNGASAHTPTAPAARSPAEVSAPDAAAWNAADALARANLARAVRGDWIAAERDLDPAVVLDDRRSLISSVHNGADAVLGYWQAASSAPVNEARRGELVTEFDTLASRGDDLVLHRCRIRSSTPDAVTELNWLRVTEQRGGRLTRITNFEPDDLTSALEALDKRYEETETDLDQLLDHRTSSFLYAALSSGDIDTAMAALHPDMAMHDHRPIGWDVQRGGGLRERFESLVEVEGTVHVYIARWLATEGSVGRWEASVEITHGTESSLVDRHQIVASSDCETGLGRTSDEFGMDQNDDAREQYEHLIAESGRRGDLWSAAVGCGGWAHWWAARGRWPPFELVADPEFMILRSDGSTIGHLDRTTPEQALTLGLGAAARQVLAIRGDRLALTELTVDSEGEEHHLLTVEEINDRCRLTRITQFDTGSLSEAAEFLNRRAGEINTTHVAEVGELQTQFGRATTTNDVEWLRTNLTDDFVVTDHRELGFGSGDIDYWIDINASRSELSGAPVPSVIIAESERGSLMRVESWRLTESGALEHLSLPALAAIQITAGRVSALELFGPDELDQATARFAELTADFTHGDQPETPGHDPSSEHDPWNDADRQMRRQMWNFEHDHETWRQQWDSGFEYHDRRSLVADIHRGVEDIEAAFPLGFLIPAETDTIATRGDRLVMYRALMTPTEALPAEWSEVPFEVLAVNRVAPTGKMDRVHFFDPDDLDGAFSLLDELYIDEAADPAMAFALRSWSLGFAVASASGEPWSSPGDARGDLRHEVNRLIACHGPVSVVEVTLRFTEPSGAQRVDTSIVVADMGAESGRCERTEQFAGDDLESALGCYDEICRAHEDRDELSNTASILANRAHSWMLSGSWELIEAYLADELSLVAGGESVRAEGRTALLDPAAAGRLEFGAEECRVLAVRGEHLALMEWAYERRDRVPHRQFAVVELDDRATLRDVRLFGWDVESLTEAADYIEARWKETTDLTEVDIALSDGITGWRHGDRAELTRCMHEDFLAKDHRPLGWGDFDKTEFIALFDPEERNVVVEIAGKYFGSTAAGRAFRFTAWGFADDELIEALPGDFVAVVRDGMVLRTEGYAVGSTEETLARLDELEAELGDPTRTESDRRQS